MLMLSADIIALLPVENRAESGVQGDTTELGVV
jgi:hypothetical protein